VIPPSREDEVDPNEDVSGKQHTKNKPEGEDEFPEGLRFGGEDGGEDGGGAILSNLGSLLVMICTVVAGSVTRGELVALNAGLLLVLRLITTLDLALVEAALDTESEGIWYLYWDGASISHGRLALMGRNGAHRLGDSDNVVNSDITKCGIGDVRWKSKDCVRRKINRSINGSGLLTTYTSGQ